MVCGNGIGLLGDAAGDCALPGTPGTGGPGGPGVDVDVPVTVCGNGIGLLGSGSGTCGPTTTPPTTEEPPVVTDPEPPVVDDPQGPQHPVAGDHPAVDRVAPVVTGSSTQQASAGSLAYTGSDLGAVLLAGLLALAAGGTLLRTSRRAR